MTGVAAFLLDAMLKTSLVLSVALFSAALLRRRSAAIRHFLLAAGLAGTLLVPALAAVVPAWHLPLPALGSAPAVPGRASAAVAFSIGQDPAPTRVADATVAVLPGADSQRAHPIVIAVIAVWITGALALLATLVAGLVRLTWIARDADRIADGPLTQIADDLRRRCGIRRAVALLQSDHPSLLVAWGLQRPQVLLPASAQRWTAARARIVLRHELAHVRRGDWGVQIAGELARAIYWFNPLVWIACAQLRDASERACDDEVIEDGVDGAEYAAHLVDLARTLNAGRDWLPAPAMARPPSLEGRISAMLNINADRRPLTRLARTAVAAALFTVAVPLAGLAVQSFHTLTGLVVDATNAFVPNATVVLTNTASAAKHEVKTDRSGRFEFVGLPSAEYVLEVRQPGFATLKQEGLLITSSLDRTIELQVGSLEETISVVGQRDARAEARPVTRDDPQKAALLADTMAKRVAARCGSGGTPAGSVGGNILAPRMLHRVNPRFPTHLQRAGVTGAVTLDARIGIDGRVQDVQVLNEPHPELAQAVTDAVRQWEFTPTYLNCTPVEVRMNVTANFAVR